MDHLQLGATMLAEWGMPEMLIHAAYHHEEPDAADFADGSRLQTLTHSLNFARSLAEVCMADEESRWSLLPGLLTRAARLGISGDALNDMVDRMVRRWREWGATLQVRTQEMPPFAEILAASPPSRRVSSSPFRSRAVRSGRRACRSSCSASLRRSFPSCCSRSRSWAICPC
jgi:two-component system cell cycle response regulator